MRHRPVLIAALFVLSASFPASAPAAWPLRDAGCVLLGYGHPYIREGAEAVHRGMDISAPEGSSVLAPAGGAVSFAGLVPGESGQVYAVSVRTADGLTVTCMPLDSVVVSAGQEIGEGGLLGMLAPTGDLSSPEPHVHVSLRREQTYLDPAAVLGQAKAAADDGMAVSDSQPEVDVPDDAVRAEAVVPLVDRAASGAADPAVRSAGDIGAAATVLEQPAREQDSAGRQATAPEGTAVAVASPEGVRAIALDTRLAARSEQRDLASRTRASRGVARALGRLARSSDSRRALIVATAGCLVAAVGLWPLWRKGSDPAFSYGVRPTLDDVAAAVGR